MNTNFNCALPAPFYLGTVPIGFHFDKLTDLFLVIIGVVALSMVSYLPGYLAHLAGRVDYRLFRAEFAILLLSMAATVSAANAPTFLIAWEVMSFSSFALVASDHELRGNRDAALIYLGATRAGTALLAGGFLWAHALTGTWSFSGWHLVGANCLAPGLLVLAGLSVKAGLWPFHLWLPLAHAAAPTPVSAVMSGVMVKVAIAVMIRLFVLTPAFSHPAFDAIILALGAISAFWGVLFALLQHDLKRLLAFHTVENVGLIVLGIGVSLVSRRLGFTGVASIALAAALFHTANHALFKSLLFLSSGAVDVGTGSRDLERLGGVGKRMPWTFACFVLGAAAICALPPLNGFASEWLLYQSFLDLAEQSAAPIVRFGGLLLVGLIGLVGALAVACFVKATGVVFGGRPRSSGAQSAHEASSGMIFSQVLLAILCVATGLFAPIILRVLQGIASVNSGGASAIASAWTLPWPTLIALLGLSTAAGLAWMERTKRAGRVSSYVTWECGFGELNAASQVSATSFAQPIMHMFGSLFRFTQILRLEGPHPRLFPNEVYAITSTESLLEKNVYAPVIRQFERTSRLIGRMQAGSIHRYLLTIFLTLLVLLAIGGNSR